MASTSLSKLALEAYQDALPYQPQEAYAQPPQQKPHHSWIKPLLYGGLGLAGLAGGAYAYQHPEMLQNVGANINNRVLDPIKKFFDPNAGNKGVIQEMDEQRQFADRAGLERAFQGIKHRSDLQGTRFEGMVPDQNGKFIDTATGASDLANTGLFAGQVGHFAAKHIPGLGRVAKGMESIPGAQTIGGLIPKGVTGEAAKLIGEKSMARAWGPLGAISNVPTGLQLGDKISDKFDISNKWGRGAIKATTAGTPLALAGAGALAGTAILPGIGTAAGATLGAAGGWVLPMVEGGINHTWNKLNAGKFQAAEIAGKADALKQQFAGALKARAQGNNNPLDAWYKLQGNNSRLAQTADLAHDPTAQVQMMNYAPKEMLPPDQQ